MNIETSSQNNGRSDGTGEGETPSETSRVPVPWSKLEANPENLSLIRLAHHLGADAGNITALLRKHAKGFSDEERLSIETGVFERRMSRSHGGIKKFVAAIRESPVAVTKVHLYPEVYEHLLKHRPEELWKHDPRLSAFAVSALTHDIPPYTAQRALQRKMGVELPINMMASYIEGIAEHLQANTPGLLWERAKAAGRQRLVHELSKNLSELSPDELKDIDAEAEAGLRRAVAESTAHMDSFRRDGFAAALVAEMLEKDIPATWITEALMYLYGYYPRLDKMPILNSTPARLRGVCEQKHLDKARQDADVIHSMMDSVKKEKTKRARDERRAELWTKFAALHTREAEAN